MSYKCCNDGKTKLPPGWTCEQVEVTPCIDYIESFTGETVPAVQPFKNISIHKPDCCDLTISIDGQVFLMPGSTLSEVLCFECEKTVVELQGDCVESTTITITNHTPALIEEVCTYDPDNGTDYQLMEDMARFPCQFINCPEE